MIEGEFADRQINARFFLEAEDFNHETHFPLTGRTAVESAEDVERYKKYLNVLLLSNQYIKDEAYIFGIGGVDHANILKFATQMAQKSEGKVVFRTVFGASEQIPFRALGYLLPGLILLEEMSEASLPLPQFQVIFAHNVSSSLNGLDVNSVRVQSNRLMSASRVYIEKFFRKISKSVVFLEDRITKEDKLLNTLAGIARIVSFEERLDKFGLKSDRHGSGDPMLYLAAHLLLHDFNHADLLSPIISGQAEPVVPEAIVSIGGLQEKDFYRARHLIRPKFGDNSSLVCTAQYFSRHHTPPYFMAHDGDISLDDVLLHKSLPDNTDVGKTAQFDIDHLFEVSDRRGDFYKFLRTVKGG